MAAAAEAASAHTHTHAQNVFHLDMYQSITSAMLASMNALSAPVIPV